MSKPLSINGYSSQYTVDCERVLVTLLRGLGPWRDSVYLVGGLTPRCLVVARPPMVPAHAGTLDVDIVIDLQILTDTEAYHTLAVAFRNERAGKHGTVIEASIAILRSRFAGDEKTEGYRKDGPVSVAKFELGADAELREARALRQRQASDVIEHLLVRIG